MGADDAQEPERCDSLSVPEEPHTLSETPVHLPPPRPPPRYRREKEKMEAAQVLKQLGDDEAARGADFRPYSPVEGAEGKIWDAARTIEQCVQRLRELRSAQSPEAWRQSVADASPWPAAKGSDDEGLIAETNDLQIVINDGAPRIMSRSESEMALAEEERRRFEAEEEMVALRTGLEVLARQSAAWREERHLQEASIEGLQSAHKHALQRIAEYQLVIPLMRLKMASLRADNRELHALLERRTEESRMHSAQQDAQLAAAAAQVAEAERRASDAEKRAAASEKVAVRHAVVANEVASKVAGVERSAAKAEVEIKRKQQAAAAASLAAAAELDAETARLAREYEEMRRSTAAMMERCARQRREIEALRAGRAPQDKGHSYETDDSDRELSCDRDSSIDAARNKADEMTRAAAIALRTEQIRWLVANEGLGSPTSSSSSRTSSFALALSTDGPAPARPDPPTAAAGMLNRARTAKGTVASISPLTVNKENGSAQNATPRTGVPPLRRTLVHEDSFPKPPLTNPAIMAGVYRAGWDHSPRSSSPTELGDSSPMSRGELSPPGLPPAPPARRCHSPRATSDDLTDVRVEDAQEADEEVYEVVPTIVHNKPYTKPVFLPPPPRQAQPTPKRNVSPPLLGLMTPFQAILKR